ncbi:MAG TPA: hypothetical protein VEQ59_19670, partial [Polyangiaceae bacterium]|nr:hypothetical protein [Polyangiaceae bacterium]
AALALREGAEGAARADAEQNLIALGLLPPKPEPSSSLAPPPPAPPAPPGVSTAPAWTGVRDGKNRWLLGVEYEARARGGEGLGQGPGALLGLQLPAAYGLIDLSLRVQRSWRSSFEAGPLEVSLQTTALRAEVGFEPQLGGDVFFQALLGGGVDVARIRTKDSEGISTRAPGHQLRGAGELAIGVWQRTSLVDVGLLASCTFLLGDVHYSLSRSAGEQRLVTPWPVQPALSLRARWGGTL